VTGLSGAGSYLQRRGKDERKSERDMWERGKWRRWIYNQEILKGSSTTRRSFNDLTCLVSSKKTQKDLLTLAKQDSWAVLPCDLPWRYPRTESTGLQHIWRRMKQLTTRDHRDDSANYISQGEIKQSKTESSSSQTKTNRSRDLTIWKKKH
jgi:hypothetical protein